MIVENTEHFAWRWLRWAIGRPMPWLLAAMVIGLLLRVHCLRFPYLWLDEFVTLWSIGGDSYAEMLDRALHWTASGPLFVLCFRASCDLLGDLEWGLKLPGVICGTLSIWAAWWTTRRLFGRSDVALVAAWLVALGPQFVNFSQEGRPYMPAALLLTLATGWLASWLRTGRQWELVAAMLLSLGAVGFQLLVALALVAQNVAVVAYGLRNRWPRRRWIEWFAAQSIVACGLWFVGVQFWMLSGRHGSMIFETNLPMHTRKLLDRDLRYEVRAEVAIVLAAIAMWWCARKFSQNTLAQAWREHSAALWVALGSYWVPAALLSLLSFARVVDPWPRYYFLFQTGFMITLAWVIVCPFPRRLAQWLVVAVGVALFCQYNWVEGVLSCRLNNGWVDFSDAQDKLRRRVGADDLVISRAGLIEANQLSFLQDPVGASYLKCFVEAKDGPLPAEHIPLPFSAESQQTIDYLEAVARDKLADRDHFWLVNLGPGDVDYREWIASRFGNRFREVEEYNYYLVVLCRYVRDREADSTDTAKNKGTSDSITAIVSKAPCQRSVVVGP